MRQTSIPYPNHARLSFVPAADVVITGAAVVANILLIGLVVALSLATMGLPGLWPVLGGALIGGCFAALLLKSLSTHRASYVVPSIRSEAYDQMPWYLKKRIAEHTVSYGRGGVVGQMPHSLNARMRR